MKQNLNRKYKNQRKWEIEEAKSNDGTYQLLRLFSRSTKMMIMHQDRALKKGYFSVEYEREGKPSGLANEDIEFFAFNFDLRDRFFIISSRLMRSKARRYYKIGEHYQHKQVKYVKVPVKEIIEFD